MDKTEEGGGPITKLEELASSAKEYADLKIDSLKLKMVENLSVLFSKVLYALILFFLLGIAVAFLASAFSSYIGKLLDSATAGQLITAAIFIFISIILYMRRRKLFTNSMVSMFMQMFFEINQKEKRSWEIEADIVK